MRTEGWPGSNAEGLLSGYLHVLKIIRPCSDHLWIAYLSDPDLGRITAGLAVSVPEPTLGETRERPGRESERHRPWSGDDPKMVQAFLTGSVPDTILFR